MSDYIIFSASNGKNLDLSNKLNELMKSKNVSSEVIDLTSDALPLYTPVSEKEGIPQVAKDLTSKMVNAKGFIFCAPEYNGSVPPTFNNHIAWVSRAAEDWRDAFNSKPTAIATHSGGGGLHVLMAMRAQLSFLGMNVIGRQLHTHYSKELSEESANAVLDQLIKLS